jgi:hypothetical protein
VTTDKKKSDDEMPGPTPINAPKPKLFSKQWWYDLGYRLFT